MRVEEKDTRTVFEVYHIVNDECGYPKFLIYKEGQWIWRSAKHFAPYTFYNNSPSDF